MIMRLVLRFVYASAAIFIVYLFAISERPRPQQQLDREAIGFGTAKEAPEVYRQFPGLAPLAVD